MRGYYLRLLAAFRGSDRTIPSTLPKSDEQFGHAHVITMIDVIKSHHPD